MTVVVCLMKGLSCTFFILKKYIYLLVTKYLGYVILHNDLHVRFHAVIPYMKTEITLKEKSNITNSYKLSEKLYLNKY